MNEGNKCKERVYIAIDLKSFYASVECVERQLDPLRTNLVVADAARTEKTICLAVSPSLKAYGIPGRARLFEVVQKVREANAERKNRIHGKNFTGKSYKAFDLGKDAELELDYIVAPPRMALYVDYSTRIYQVYLKYVAPEDMHVYSIDEVFLDVTDYLLIYKMSPEELARKIVTDVLKTTGITATAGIGSNMYLCKIAMDIEAKHIEADENGVRIASLNEKTYREKMWNHRPLTDFWRVGRGYAKKLEENGLYTMGDVARCSLGRETDYYNEDFLYRLFGINAELLIDHAWGYEPVTIADVKAYRPSTNSISQGQVLTCPYDYEKTRLIVNEMTDLLVLDLVDKKLYTNQIVLTIGYDIENLKDSRRRKSYRGEITTDRYGRKVPKHAHGTANLPKYTASTRIIMEAVNDLYIRIVNPELLTRRITISANQLVDEDGARESRSYEQMDLFTDYKNEEKTKEIEEAREKKERRMQEAVLSVKKKYGKNAILRGMNFKEGATAKERNGQIGGHKA